MGDEIDIIGPLTEAQKQDMTDARENRNKTLRHKAMREFEQRQAACVKEHKPFCFRCAKLDYEKAQEDTFNLTSSRAKYGKLVKDKGLSWIAKNIPIKVNFEPYEDSDRWKLESTDTKTEQQRVNGVRITYVTTYETYRCLVRGCHLSIQIKEDTEREDASPSVLKKAKK